MSDHADRERRTARLVQACYARYVAGGKVAAEKLYALCQLTWITKGSATSEDRLPDNTRVVIAPALTALTGTEITATTIEELPEQLRQARAPPEIVRLVAKPLGFTNFYAAFRNVARPWITKHRRDVTAMMKLVATASSDRAVRQAYALLDQLPALPRRTSGGMPAAALITPMLACLDLRSRSPIINSRGAVQKRLQLLGLRHATVREQFDGFVNLIGQAGIRDAFDLDTSNMEVVVAALNAKPRSRSGGPRVSSVSGATRSLGKRDDADVEYFRSSDRVTMRREHNRMTNGLRRYCQGRGLTVEEGSTQSCMFDALIRDYHGSRHLLAEVKPDSEQPSCRLAVGQLLDYRRQLPDRARIDLAALFPKLPSARAKAFLDDVGIRPLWFSAGMKLVKGFELLPSAYIAKGDGDEVY